MNIILELPIKKDKLDCGSPLGPLLAPYGVNINKVVDALNKMLAENKITIHSKVHIEIDLEDRSWKFVETHKKITEQLKELSKNGKINYSDLFSFAKKSLDKDEFIKIK